MSASTIADNSGTAKLRTDVCDLGILPMNSALFLALAFPFAGFAYLFAKNLLRARDCGEIYNQQLLVRRAESPGLFRLTVALYVIATAFVVACAGACVFAFFFL
jgi:hypothetical protein